MFGEKADLKILDETSREIATVLDKDASFEGKMTFDGSVLIHGKFKGEIFSEGTLIIGEGGSVEGQINIGQIQIKGGVRGNIQARDRIEILAPASVQGDIASPSLVIKEGAVFEGNCSMGRQAEPNVVDFSSHNKE